MTISEVLVAERNRLLRMSTFTTIMAVVLATWSRAPLMSFKLPLGGAEVENLTAGHVVLIGYPFFVILILLLAGQMLRVDQMVQEVSEFEAKYASWTFPDLEGYAGRVERLVAQTSGGRKVSHDDFCAIPSDAYTIFAIVRLSGMR